MEELTQEEKELILVSLGSTLADPEQSDIHSYTEVLYEKLRMSWLADPSGYHTAKQIADTREEESL